MKVPFLDLKAQYRSIREEVDQAIQEVISSCAFAGGPFVEAFENDFAAFCETKYCRGVGSGTEALWLALIATGVKPGDEVITVPNTFIATAEAISLCGARLQFVDIEETTYTMDPNKLKSYLENRFSSRNSTPSRMPKAVVPVHLYGQTADMDPIMEIANAFGLSVIEDAAQAHGAKYKGRMAGSIGDAGCFSFYPGKNLGAYGEAGAVITNNENVADEIFKLRDHGQSEKYFHGKLGWNSRMDGIQGAVLNVKLKHLPAWNENRRHKAEQYKRLLPQTNKLILPAEHNNNSHVYHIFPVRVQDRNNFMNWLENREIFCAIHYPLPIHLQEAYSFLGKKVGTLPVSEKVAKEVVSLPIFPEMVEEQIIRVSGLVTQYFHENKSVSIGR
jgi:dTDP-4-amino-4,6-dideoxygalactose transaminase